MISVIIPTFNTALLIERTLRSVLNQSLQDFEIIIVDDASTDNTLEVVENLRDSRIRIFRQQQNQGPAAARNRGLWEARGEYCAFLDGDDYWEPDFLKETAGFLTAHPEAIAVSVMQRHNTVSANNQIVPKIRENGKRFVIDDFYAYWWKYSHCMTGSILIRTQTGNDIGGMREDLRICEDLEFWNLLATQGRWGMIARILFTSDGSVVSRSLGWVEKNLKRWNSAPTVDEWAKRIRKVFANKEPASWPLALSRIARNLIYCHIMSKKDLLARYEVQLYGNNFPDNKINKLFRWAAISALTWKIWCYFLRYREFHRKI